MLKSFNELLEMAASRKLVKIAVAMANDEHVIEAVSDAAKKNLATPILVGPEDEVKVIVHEIAPDLDYELIDAKDKEEAAKVATQLVSSGKADILMKGLVDTSVIMSQVLNKEYGLRTGNVLSHVAVFSIPAYHKILFLTDAGMNIAPDVDQKQKLIENVVPLCHSMGLKEPKVAMICAKENVSEKMQATIDAAEIQKRNEEGKITGCVVQGPLALDNAISKEAAEIKGISGEVAGDADVLLMPMIEAGNVLYKAFTYFAGAESAGMILGATHPIVLTSRADSADSKLYSIALAVLLATKDEANG